MTRNRVPVGRILLAIILMSLALRLVGGGLSLLAGVVALPLLILKVAIIVLVFRWLFRHVIGRPRRHRGGYSRPGFQPFTDGARTGCHGRSRRPADRRPQWSDTQEPHDRMSPEETEWEGFLAQARDEVDGLDSAR